MENEIQSLKLEVNKYESKLNLLIPEQVKLLQVLATHGAIPEYNSIRQNYLDLQARSENLTNAINEIKNIREKKEEIKANLFSLSRQAESDKLERINQWKEAVISFNNITKHLYNREGNLILNIDEKKGYEFEVQIGDKDQSAGISKMKIFSLDYVLLKLWAKQENRINFLIHDSMLFDPVDPRQNETALIKMAELTNELNAQYICTINSDRIENFESPTIQNYVRYRLKDDSEDGLLLGFEYNSQYNSQKDK